MTLQSRLTDLATAVGADIKDLQSQIPELGVVTLDPWHIVGAAGQPAFQGTWVSYGADRAPRFRKDVNGKVKLAGAAKSGVNNTVVFTLPVGYRPAVVSSFVGYFSGGTGQITVLTDGTVTLANLTGTGATQASLDGVEFDTETVTTFEGVKGDTGATGGNAMVPMDTWHVVGTAGEPVFKNSWVNWDATRVARFRKYPDGKVRLHGVIKSGATASVAFTLPAAYCPQFSESFPIVAGTNSSGFVTIAPNGDVVPTNIAGNVTTYAFLDGIEFDTETVTQYAVGQTGEPGPALVNVTAHTFLPNFNTVAEPLIGYGDITTVGQPDFDHYLFTSVEVTDPEMSDPSGVMYVQTCVGLYSPEKVWRRYRVGSFISSWVRLSGATAEVILNKSTTTSLTTAVESSIAFNTEESDPFGFHTGSDIWAIVPSPAGKDLSGQYHVSFECWYASNATNARYTRLYRDRGGTVYNFASDIRAGTAGGVATIARVSEVIDLEPGDKVWPSMYQNSGGALVTPASTTRFKMTRIANI